MKNAEAPCACRVYQPGEFVVVEFHKDGSRHEWSRGYEHEYQATDEASDVSRLNGVTAEVWTVDAWECRRLYGEAGARAMAGKPCNPLQRWSCGVRMP